MATEHSMKIGIDGTSAPAGARVVNMALDDISTKATITNQSLQNIENSLSKVGSNSNGIKSVTRNLDDVTVAGKSVSVTMQQIEDRIIRVGVSAMVFMTINRVIGEFKTGIKESLEYLGKIETASIGIAAAYNLGGQYIVTATGKALTGTQAFNVAQKDSIATIEQLNLAHFRTTATLDQLVRTYQVVLPQAQTKAFDRKQVLEYTVAMVQAAGAIGIAYQTVAVEARHMLDGTANPRMAKIATVLGLNTSNTEYMTAVKQGGDILYDYLMKKLESFRVASFAVEKSWAGMWSNLKSVALQSGGMAFDGLFVGIKGVIQGILDNVVTVDRELHKVSWNEDFIKKGKEIGNSITNLFQDLVAGTKFLYNHGAAIITVIEGYVAYKVGILAVAVAQKLVNTEMMQTVLLAGRVAQQSLFPSLSGGASYINSAGSNALRAKQSLDNAAALSIETQATLENATAKQILAAEQAQTDTLTAKRLQGLAAYRAAQNSTIFVDIEELTVQRDLTAARIADTESMLAQLTTKQASGGEGRIINSMLQKDNAILIAQQLELDALVANNPAVKAAAAAAAAKDVQIASNSRLVTSELEVVGASTANVAAQEALIVAEGVHTASLERLTVVGRLYTLGAEIAAATTTVLGKAMALVGGPIGVVVIAVMALYYAIDKLLNKERERQTFLAGISNDGGTAKYIADIKAIQKQIDDLAIQNASPEEKKNISQLAFQKEQISNQKELLRLQTQLSNMSWISKQITVAPGVTREDELNARIHTLQDSLRSAPALESEKQALQDKLDAALKYKQNKQPAGPIDNTAYNEAVSAYNALLKVQDEWEMSATKSSKTQDELGTAIAAVTLKFDQQIDATKKASMFGDYKSIVADIEYNKQLQIQNMKDAADKKAMLADDAAMRQEAIQQSKTGYANETASLKEQLADRLISQTQFHEKVASAIDKYSKVEIDVLQTITDKREEELTAAEKSYNSNEENALSFSQYLAIYDKYSKSFDDVSKAEDEWSKKRHDNNREAIKDIESQRIALVDLQNTAKDAQLAVAASKASRVGTSPLTGAVTDPVANAQAMATSAYDIAIQGIDRKNATLKVEQDNILSAWNAEKDQMAALEALRITYAANEEKRNIAELTRKQTIASAQKTESQVMYDAIATQAQKAFPKITAFHQMAAIAGREYDKTTSTQYDELTGKDLTTTELSTKGKMSMMSDYGALGGQIMSDMAASQDQSSRKGFETAKAFNLAAAIMSTASGIMNQFSTGDPYTAWFRAALVGVAGAIQIAKIASTSFGGGGSVSAVPAGANGAGGGGGAAGSGAGSAVSAPLQSAQDSMSAKELDRVANSIDGAAVVMAKAGDTFMTVADMFKTTAMTMLMQIMPGKFTQTSINSGTLAHGSITNEVDMITNAAKGFGGLIKDLFSLNFQKFGNDIGSTFYQAIGGDMVWGGSWKTNGAGISIGLSNGQLQTSAYNTEVRDPGLFQRNQHRTVDMPIDPALVKGLSDIAESFKTSIEIGAKTFGISTKQSAAAFAAAKIPSVNINTAKVGNETDAAQTTRITDAITAQINLVSAALADTIPGLHDFALGGENLYDTFIRIAGAMTEVQSALSLVGAKALPTTGALNDMAYQLVNLMGGTDAFKKSMDTYLTGGMFTQAQQDQLKYNDNLLKIKTSFSILNRETPKTNEEFISLVNSLDLTTDSGMQTFASLMDVQQAFADTTKYIKELTQAQLDLNSSSMSKILNLTDQASLATLYDLQVSQEKDLADAKEKGLDTSMLLQAQTLEMADAMKTAATTVSVATQKILDAAKKGLTDSLSYAQSIIQLRMGLMTGPAAMLTPEAAYNQSKQQFGELTNKSDASTVATVTNAFLTASKNMFASGTNYQDDFKNATDKLKVLGDTGDTVSDMQKQLNLLTKIATAVGDNDGVLVKQLSLTWEALQIDTGAATSSLSTAYKALSTLLGTPLVLGNPTAAGSAESQIALLQDSLNTGVTGTAKTAINTAIGSLQLALNGTISSTTATTAINTTYSLVQGALNGTISGTMASQGVATQYSIVQAALNGTVTGAFASQVINTQYAIVQASLNGSITSATAQQAIAGVYSSVQGVLNGTITSGAAAGTINTTYNTIQGALNGTISSKTAATAISSQYSEVNGALNDGLNTGDNSVSSMLEKFNSALTTSASETQKGLTNFVNALAIVGNYTSQRTQADMNLTSLKSQYTSGAITADQYNTQAGAIAGTGSALAGTIASGVTAGLTSLTTPTYGITDADTVLRTNAMDNNMKAKAGSLGYASYDSKKGFASSDATGIALNIAKLGDVIDGLSIPTNATTKLWDLNGDNYISSVDLFKWMAIGSGAIKWSSLGLPAFAAGSSYVPNDMTANIHQGEIIMDRASSDVLRKYGIPQNGSADSRTAEGIESMTKELKALRSEVNALRQQQAKEHSEDVETANQNTGKVAIAVGGNAAARVRY